MFHNAAAAVVVGGKVLAALEEERVTRRKNDAGWPHGAIDACMAIAGIAASDLAGVAYYERPLRCLTRKTPHCGVGRDPALALECLKTIARHVRKLSAQVPVYYFSHHLAHAASAFLTSGFNSAAVLVADGVGEDTCASIWRASRSGIRCVWRDEYPDSFGLVYSYMTQYLGFQPMQDEYKVMGLAAWGDPRYLRELGHIIGFDANGHVRVEPDWVMSVLTGQGHPGRLDEKLFGPRRQPGNAIEQRHKDIAASLQTLLTSWLVQLSDIASKRLPQERNLCLAGGVAHNCRAIGELQERSTFEKIFIQPAAGDAGGALGAALLPALVCGEWQPPDRAFDPYLGPSYSREQYIEALAAANCGGTEMTDVDLVRHTSAELAQGRIVGWFQGRAEFGPRALGNRSILASPLFPNIGHILNTRIKHREAFRPFAPAVLAECAGLYFQGRWIDHYMLVTGRTEPSHVDALRAVTHVDGTARVQLVDADMNPLFHQLIRQVWTDSGYPIVLNTSLNHSSEPIALSPSNALRTARLCGLDGLVLGPFYVDMSNG